MTKTKKKSIVVLFFLIVIGCFVACDRVEPKRTYTRATTQLEELDGKEEVVKQEPKVAVIKKIKPKKQYMVLIDVNTEEELNLSYTGGLEIFNKYGTIMSVSQLKVGDMVDLYYEENTGKMSKVQISNFAWEVKNLTALSIDKIEKKIKVLGKKYSYTGNLIIADDKNLMELIEICDEDVVTARGYKGKICSLVLEVGHGYVSLESYDTLIDGTIQIGTDIFLPITENMLIAVPEGTYKLQIEKNGEKNSKNVVVKRNKETVVSLAEFQIPAVQQSTVLFQIEPEDAMVLIDGQVVNCNDTVTLDYGEHEINVSLEGYHDYVETLVLDQAYMIYKIELAKEDSTEETNVSSEVVGSEESTTSQSSNTTASESGTVIDIEEEETQATQQEEETSQSETDKATTTTETQEQENSTEEQVTTKQKVYITQPEGVKIYFDSKYIGVSPINFKKVTGTHIITLSKNGYETKSYTITLLDDGKDTYFSFPSMLELEN